MKIKQLIILFVIVLLLGGAIFLKNYRFSQPIEEQEYKKLEFVSALGEIQTLSVRKGSSDSEEKFSLSKGDKDNWRVESFDNLKAKDDRVEALIKSLRALEGELRSISKDNIGDFLIGDDAGIRIDAQDKDGQESSIVVGLKTAGFGGSFIREIGSHKVYLAAENILSKLGIWQESADVVLKPEFFYDLQMLEFEEGEVSSFTVERKEGESLVEVCNVFMSIEEGSDIRRWSFSRQDIPFDVDASKIKKFLAEVKKKSANEIISDEQGQDYGFDNPVWRMSIDNTVILAGNWQNDEQSKIYMKKEGSKSIFVVSKYIFESIDKDDSYFFIDNPLRIGEDTEEIIIYSERKQKKFLQEEKEIKPQDSEDGQPREKEIVKKWVYEGEKDSFSDSEIENIVAAFKKFKPQKILFTQEDFDKKKTEWIAVKNKDKEEIDIDIFIPIDSNKGYFLARKRGAQLMWTISQDTYQNIF